MTRRGATWLRLFGRAIAPVNPLLRRVAPMPRIVETGWQLPPGRGGPSGLRLAFLADLHLGPTTTVETVRTAVSLTSAAKPDVVLLGGDFLFRNPAGADALGRTLAQLRAPLGILAVLGNHDHWLDARRVARALQDAGVQLLHNRGLRLRTPMGSAWICGVDDLWAGRPDLDQALDGRRPGEVTILMSHNGSCRRALRDGFSRSARAAVGRCSYSPESQRRMLF